MNAAEQMIFAALRDADAAWLELWEVAKFAGVGVHRAAIASGALRRRGLLVKRPSARGLSSVEVSLAAGGVW